MGAPLELFDGVVPFVTVLESGSFTEAARRLGVTTSAVSKAVTRLEAALGVRLLYRSSHRIAATVEGDAFLGECRGAVEVVAAARAQLAEGRARPSGRLRVSLVPGVAARVVAGLPALLAACPMLGVDVTDTGEVDVAVQFGAKDSLSRVAKKLRDVTLVTVASPGYLARRGEPSTPDALAEHECIGCVQPNGRAAAWRFLRAGEAISHPLGSISVAFDPVQLDHAIAAAVAGLGVAQFPDVLVGDALARGSLVEVLAASAAPGAPLVALCAPGGQRAPKVRAFLDLVASTLSG